VNIIFFLKGVMCFKRTFYEPRVILVLPKDIQVSVKKKTFTLSLPSRKWKFESFRRGIFIPVQRQIWLFLYWLRISGF